MIIHGAVSTEVVKRIYDLGVLQAIEVVEDPKPQGASQLQGLSDEMAYCLGEFEERLREVARALEILTDFDDPKRQVIENFVTLKQRISRKTLDDVGLISIFSKRLNELQELHDTLKHLQERQGSLRDNIELLQMLAPLPFPLDELEDLTTVQIQIGQIRKEVIALLSHDLSEYDDRVYYEEIAEKGPMVYLFFMHLPEATLDNKQDPIVSTLEQYGFDAVDLSGYSHRIPEEIQRLTQEVDALDWTHS